MTLATALVIAAEAQHTGYTIQPWVLGIIALCAFAALAFVTWTYRDVANRHSHKSVPNADAHAGAPGATHHGTGHPRPGSDH